MRHKTKHMSRTGYTLRILLLVFFVVFSLGNSFAQGSETEEVPPVQENETEEVAEETKSEEVISEEINIEEELESSILPKAEDETIIGDKEDLSETDSTENLQKEEDTAPLGLMETRNVSDFVIEDGVLVSYKGSDSVVTIPDGVTAIWSYAFENNKTVETVHIPQGVTRIFQDAFRECTSLQKVTLPTSLEQIDDRVFYGCTSLSDINLENVKHIGHLAFDTCNLKEANLKSALKVVRSAFSDNKNMTKLTLGEGVLLEGNCFNGCSSLKNVVIPADSTLESGAFMNCTALESVVIHEGTTLGSTLHGSVFSGCSSLERVQLPSSLDHIPPYTFKGCGNLKNLDLSNIKEIGFSAFHGTGLEHVDLSKIQRIGHWAFGEAKSLKTVQLGNQLNWTDTSVFADCESLESIRIPGSLREIKDYTFSGCTSLKKITVDEGVKILGEDVFNWCSALTEVNLPSTLQKISYGAFTGCTGLVEMMIPEGVEEVQQHAFDECTNLKKIYIPSTAKTLDPFIFFNTTPTIYGTKGSRAESYARENSLPFVAYSSVMPKPVQNFRGKALGIEAVQLTWDASENAEGYFVFRKAATERSFAYIGTTKNTVFNDMKATAKEYNFYLVYPYRTNMINGKKEMGRSTSYVYVMPKPTPVKYVQSKLVGNVVAVSWQKIQGAHYAIYRKVQGEKDVKYMYVVGPERSSWADLHPVKGKVNYYFVLPYIIDNQGRMHMAPSRTYGYAVVPR